MKNKLGTLGKGLGALLPTGMESNYPSDNESEMNSSSQDYFLCPVAMISPNPHQPRREMDDTTLMELSRSIQENGIIQPLVVRRTSNGFELIAGERRWRAAQLAHLDSVPVIVKNISETGPESLEMALVENIQRQNLNPLDEAYSYRTLADEFHLTQEQIAGKVGKERSTVANALRLLHLPEFVLADIRAEKLTQGHARALLSLLDFPDLLAMVHSQIISKNLSVRQTEQFVKSVKNPPVDRKKKGGKEKSLPESYCRTICQDIEKHLQTKNRIIQNGSRGKIEIEYYSFDDLERLLNLIIVK